jgi:hypothetical protein
MVTAPIYVKKKLTNTVELLAHFKVHHHAVEIQIRGSHMGHFSPIRYRNLLTIHWNV